MNDSPTPAVGEWRARAILLFISLVLSLATAEAALRILGIGAPVVREGSGGFTFFTHHPRLGWDLVPGARDRLKTPEMDVEIRITEQGLRSHRLLSPTPDPGVRRIVVIGDSFSFGHGVEVEEAWPARLEGLLGKKLSVPVEVANLSVTGYGTDQQLLRFEDRGIDLKPDAVILGLFVGNIFRNAREVQIGYPKPRFRLEKGTLRLTNVPVPPRATAPGGPSRLWNLAASLGRTAGEHLGYGEAWSVTGAILDRLRHKCEDIGAEFSVAVIPKDQVVYGQGWRQRIHQRTQEATGRLLRSHDLPYLDLTDALRHAAENGSASDRLYFPVDGHWTSEGHRIAAESLAQWWPTSTADPTP